MVQRILKLLTVEGAVKETCEGRERLYCRIIEGYQEDFGRIKQYIDLRWKEWYEINRYTQYNGCLMEYLQKALNDTTAQQCQRCANCQQKGFTSDVPADLVIEAEDFLKECSIVIKPKDKAPGGLINTGVKIPPNLKNYPGQSLSYYGDAGWGQCVKNGKYQKNYFADELVTASVHLILIRWRPNPFPQWVAAIPSKRHPNLVADFAKRLAECLNIPFIPVLGA